MRNRFEPVRALAICVCLGGILAAHPAAAQRFTNGGFETADMTGWTIDGSNPTPSATTTSAHTGTHSAFM